MYPGIKMAYTVVLVTVTILVLTHSISGAPTMFRGFNRGQKPSPMIFIPGKGGSQIEARVDRTENQKQFEECPAQKDWDRLWLDVWQFLWPGQIDCWAENARLHYNQTTKQSTTAPGVEFRVPGFGDTYSVEYVDDSWAAYLMANIGAYLVYMADELESWGYTRGKNIRAAPYDFRFAPHSHMEYFDDLRLLVEETYTINDNTPVTLVAHSMGGIQGLYFFSTVSQEWKDKYINAYVPVNTPWKGCIVISNLYTSGYNWGITPLDKDIIRTQQRSWETGVMLLPQEPAWGHDDPVVITPTRNYTVHDYDDYFHDIGHPLGGEMFDNVRGDLYDFSHPGVDTYCVYSYGLETPDHLVYEEGQFPHGDAKMVMGEGDGTVNLKSLEYCKHWLVKHDSSHVAAVQTFEYLPHINIIFHADFFQFLKRILYS